MEKNAMSAQLLEVSLLGVGTVLRLERGARSMVKWLRQATNEYRPPPTAVNLELLTSDLLVLTIYMLIIISYR